MIVGEELPKALRADERVAADRAVIERLVLIAPYAPARESVEISDAVHRAFIYRHSKAPADDCSRSFADGPWLSLRPHCSEATRCWDYDYSLEPDLAFLGRQGSRSGGMLGHCNIVGVVAKVAAVNLKEGEEIWAEYAPRLADGTPGGREHPQPPPPPPPP